MKNSIKPEEMQKTVKTYSKSLLRFAYTFVKSTSDAEDIVQEVFISFMNKAPHFETEAMKRAWLYKVTTNKAKDFLKSAWKKRVDEFPADLSYLPDEDMRVITYVLSLDEKYKIPIHLHYYDGYSIEEIANILNANPATVGTWLARGRKLLKQAIGDDFDE